MKTSLYYNPQSLTFEKRKRTLPQQITRFLIHSSSIVLPSIFVSIIIFIIFGSPQERILEKHISDILFKYEMLNDEIKQKFAMLDEIESHDTYFYRQYFEAKPIPQSVRTAGYGGSARYLEFKDYQYSKVMTEAHLSIDNLSKKLIVQSVSFDEIILMLADKQKMLLSIPSIQPVSVKDVYAVGPFGMRFHPILHINRMHNGVDLCAKGGSNVYASGDSYVKGIKYHEGMGNYIVLDHGYGYETWYGHLRKILVQEGQKIKRGELIGLVGTTGLSNIDHLHYEVHKNGIPVDPVYFYYNDLNIEDYDKMLSVCSERNVISD